MKITKYIFFVKGKLVFIIYVNKTSIMFTYFQLAEKGGFVVQGDCGQFLRNPATPYICPLLDNLINLLKYV